jgi:hypothetical protein
MAMKTHPDYDRIADDVRRVLMRRLEHPTEGRRFTLVVLTALARDDKLHELLLETSV